MPTQKGYIQENACCEVREIEVKGGETVREDQMKNEAFYSSQASDKTTNPQCSEALGIHREFLAT